jgi:demethylmenaquinone methyltransferase/2-methoxy-6-polyprenyl-1,4-benzoquinol methylase
VLKPGGILLILDFCRPQGRAACHLARFHLKKVIPWLVRFMSGGRPAQRLMDYCWDTVNECVPPQQILDRLSSEGFEQLHTKRYGMLIEYRATTPR